MRNRKVGLVESLTRKNASKLLIISFFLALAFLLSRGPVAQVAQVPLGPTTVVPHSASNSTSSDPIGDEWSMFHGQLNHTGVAASSPLTNAGPMWYTELFSSSYSASAVFASPAVSNGRVYVTATGDILHCLDAATGALVWNYTLTDYGYCSPAVAGGHVFVADSYNMTCLDAATGAYIWSYHTGGACFMSSPAVYNGSVYFGSSNWDLYCLNVTTGAQEWTYGTTGRILNGPAVVNGRAYFGSEDGNLYCIDATNGSYIWSNTTSSLVEDSSPAVANGLVYQGSMDHSLYCLNATTGNINWSYPTGGEVESSPAVANGRVYVGSDDDHLYCLNATTGNYLWNLSTPTKAVLSSPAVANGRVYVGGEDANFYCLDAATGAVLWVYQTLGYPSYGIESSPAIADGCVYVGGMDCYLYCLPMILTSTDVPAAPVLQAITPSTSTSGIITLNWSSVQGATSYMIYRNNKPTLYTSVVGATAIATGVTGTTYEDVLAANDTYYYAVESVNGTGNSGPSNCVSVTTAVPPANSDPTGDEWPMFRGELNHTGVASTTPIMGPVPLWNTSLGSSIYSSPAVADGRVFVGCNDRSVNCLNATTGAILWYYWTSGEVTSSPAVANGRVFVGSDDGWLYCLDELTGNLLWNYYIYYNITSSPSVANGSVYFGGGQAGALFCLNAFNGTQRWNYTDGNVVDSSPAVANGFVYYGSYNYQNVTCLDATTGAFKWNYTTGSGVSSSPAIANGRVYVGSFDNKIYCLDATTGAKIWNYPTGGRVDSSPAVANGRVYVGSWDKHLYCLDATTGAHIWNYTAGDSFRTSSPAVANGIVYVGCNDGNLYYLNATDGSLLNNFRTGNTIFSSPAVANGSVYFGSWDTYVYRLPATLTVPPSPVLNNIIPNPSTTGIINLSWTSVPAAANYRLYRASFSISTASGLTPLVVSVGGTTYQDTISASGTYYYAVVAYNGTGNSSISNCISVAVAIPPSSDPTGDEWPMFRGMLNHTGVAVTSPVTSAAPLWIYRTFTEVDSSPAVVGGQVYIGCNDGNLYCFDVTTGARLWYYGAGAAVQSSPAVAGGLVYFGAGSSVICLYATNGTFVWSHALGGIYSSPAVYFGRVYVGSYDHNVYCLDASTGSVLWNYTTGGWVYSSPAVAGGWAYVGSQDCKLYCFNATTGLLNWSYTTTDAVDSSPAVAGQYVYFGTDGGKLYCLDTSQNGSKVWSSFGGISSPAVSGGRVFVGAGARLYAFDAMTGNYDWSYITGGFVDSSPAVVGGRVYVGSYDYNMYCVDAATGTLLWNYRTYGAVSSSPAVAGGYVYVGGVDGYLYCFPAILTVPVSPVMNPIVPSTSATGQISLSWSSVTSATSYSIYRGNSMFYGTYSQTPFATGVTGTSYQDTLVANGTYYYIVVAVNASGSSSMSNVQSVVVGIPLTTNGVTQVVSANTPTTVQCESGGTDLADLNVTASRPVSITMNFTTTAAPGNVSLPNALGYIQINCNDTAALSFPMNLTIYYDPAAIAAAGIDPSQLGIWYLSNTSGWEFIGGVVNTTAHSVTVTLTHFSTYAIAPISPPSADFHAIGIVLGVLVMAMIGIGAVVDYKRKRKGARN